MSNKKSHYNKLASTEDTRPLDGAKFEGEPGLRSPVAPRCHVSAMAVPKGKARRASVRREVGKQQISQKPKIQFGGKYSLISAFPPVPVILPRQ